MQAGQDINLRFEVMTPERTPLERPLDRKSAQQLLKLHPRWLPSTQDRFDEIGGK
jgi:hypothetical protein